MSNNYKIRVPFSVNGIKSLSKKIRLLQSKLPEIQMEFKKQSLLYIKQQAIFYIQSTTGNSQWYELTHLLEESFITDYNLGTLINDCAYSAFVEYGTGIVGKGTHPDPKNYQYDVNSHGEKGWGFKDNNGNLHFTKGMEAHRFMYNAVNDYCMKGEYKRIFKEAVNKELGGLNE